MGRPNLAERHWLWIYLAPICATLSLLGAPFTVGWVAHYRAYADLLVRAPSLVWILVVLAEGLAFAGLWGIWQGILQPKAQGMRGLWATLLLSMPFLIPGVSGFVFEAMTGLQLGRLATAPNQAGNFFLNPSMALTLMWILGLVFGIQRTALLQQSPWSTAQYRHWFSLVWLWSGLHRVSHHVSSVILRIWALIEGSHYIGWAVLILLIGLFMVLLR